MSGVPRRSIGGIRSDSPETGLDTPHHDGSELYVDRLDDSAELRLRAPEDAADTKA